MLLTASLILIIVLTQGSPGAIEAGSPSLLKFLTKTLHIQLQGLNPLGHFAKMNAKTLSTRPLSPNECLEVILKYLSNPCMHEKQMLNQL